MSKHAKCSHDKIHRIFSSPDLPADSTMVFNLVRWLGQQGPRPRFREGDEEAEEKFLDEFDAVWKRAERWAALPPLPAHQVMPVQRRRPREPKATSNENDPNQDVGNQKTGSSARSSSGTQQPDGVPRQPLASADPGESPEQLFPDPGHSRALLVATGHFDSPDLPDIPSVLTSAQRLAAVLTRPERKGIIPDTNVLLDPVDPLQILEALEYTTRAEDTVIVHLACHGTVTPQGQLTIPTKTSRPDSRFSSLAWNDVRELVAESPAKRSVVIVDACFSGRALQGAMGTADAAFHLGVTELLTSTGTYDFAFTDEDGPAFTKALIELLELGDPNLPDVLTTEEIYRGLHNWSRRENRPLPQRFRSGQGSVALGLNPATPALSQTTESADPPTEDQ